MFTSVAVDSSSNDRRTLHYLSQLVETADTNSTPDMCRVRVKSSEVRTPRSRALSADLEFRFCDTGFRRRFLVRVLRAKPLPVGLPGGGLQILAWKCNVKQEVKVI